MVGLPVLAATPDHGLIVVRRDPRRRSSPRRGTVGRPGVDHENSGSAGGDAARKVTCRVVTLAPGGSSGRGRAVRSITFGHADPNSAEPFGPGSQGPAPVIPGRARSGREQQIDNRQLWHVTDTPPTCVTGSPSTTSSNSPTSTDTAQRPHHHGWRTMRRQPTENPDRLRRLPREPSTSGQPRSSTTGEPGAGKLACPVRRAAGETEPVPAEHRAPGRLDAPACSPPSTHCPGLTPRSPTARPTRAPRSTTRTIQTLPAAGAPVPQRRLINDVGTAVPGDPLARPNWERPGPVGDAVEARVERLRDHLRRSYRSQQRQLAINASYTIDRTDPETKIAKDRG